MHEDIPFEARVNGGSGKSGGLMGALGRPIAGAGAFRTHFENVRRGPAKVSFAAHRQDRVIAAFEIARGRLERGDVARVRAPMPDEGRREPTPQSGLIPGTPGH